MTVAVCALCLYVDLVTYRYCQRVKQDDERMVELLILVERELLRRQPT